MMRANRFDFAGHAATLACWRACSRFACAVVLEVNGEKTRDATRIAASMIGIRLMPCETAVLMRPLGMSSRLLIRYHYYTWIQASPESAPSLFIAKPGRQRPDWPHLFLSSASERSGGFLDL